MTYWQCHKAQLHQSLGAQQAKIKASSHGILSFSDFIALLMETEDERSRLWLPPRRNMLTFTLLQQSGRQPETKGRCCDAVRFFCKVYFLGLCIHAICLFTFLVCTVSTRGSLPLRNDFVYWAIFTYAQAYTLLSVMANHFLRWDRSQTGLTRFKQGHELNKLGFF